MNVLLRLTAALLLLLSACGKREEKAEAPPPSATAPAEEAAVDRVSQEAVAAFDTAVRELTIAYFDELPEMATYVGAPEEVAPGAGARLAARSPDADTRRRERLESELRKLKAVDGEKLDGTRALQREVLVAQFDGTLAPARAVAYGSFLGEYGAWFTPYAVWQNGGPVVSLPNILEAQHQVRTAKDAENYLLRLTAYARVLDDAAEKLRHDAALDVIPPDFVIEKTQAVIRNFISTEPAQNVLVASFTKKLEAAGIADRETLVARAAKVVGEDIYAADRRLLAALDEIKPRATHDAGVWRLPKGEALYAALIRQMTDTTMSAEEIHQIGLSEVDRILGEMDAILKAQGHAEGTVGERMRRLAEERRFFYPDTEEGRAAIIADAEAQLKKALEIAPQWFGTLPKYGVEVRRVPEFSQDSAPGGYYDSPALDGSRPGIYWINLRDTAIWPRFSLPTLTYHEAVPGHHFQNAIALRPDAPILLSTVSSNAFGEGWALYSEALAKEMGLYEGDPYGDLGRLQDELHRAIRLVVDTGMHAKRWSREQAIQYMADIEGVHPKEVESEIERYVVWPGQALGYKIGMLKIQELRRNAEAELGDNFDIRAFHDVVLKDGAVPLSILEKKIEAFVAERRG